MVAFRSSAVLEISFVVICFVGIGQVRSADNIIFTQILYRHGDRAPYYSYPKNAINESFWPQGYEQLTTIGMQQHFALGKYFRERYILGKPYRLLNESYRINEIYARSDDVERTLMSAECNLAGLYPPSGDQIWNKDIKWQPIPVHTQPSDTDYMINMEVNCPKFDQLHQAVLSSKDVQQEEANNKEFYEYIMNMTGLDFENITQIWEIYDLLLCQSIHNITLPEWTNKTWNGVSTFDKMKALYAYSCDLQFNQNDGERRLRGGPILGAMINNMKWKISGQMKPPQRKAVFYSAHDDTIVALLSALKVYNKLLPPYASAVIVDLIQRTGSDGEFEVQLFYKNDSLLQTHYPYPLTIPGCSGNCTFDEFVRITHDNIPVDWFKECSTDNSKIILDVASYALICFSAVALVVFIFCLVSMTVRCLRRRSQPLYHNIQKE